MISFNAFGGIDKVPTGTYIDHSHGSTRYDTSSIIPFSWDHSMSCNDSFFIDDAIASSPQMRSSGRKYGWLMESKAVIPNIYEDFTCNIDMYMRIFDMVFTSDRSIYEKHDRIKFVPANTLWVRKPKLYTKSKLVSMISSNNHVTDGHKLRIDLINSLPDFVDIYGRQINPIPMKEFGLKQYMFSFAIENSSYETYFTEKILDCFATGTVPIYWGAPDISDHFNIDGIVVLDDNFDISNLSIDLYKSKHEAIVDNFNRSKNYVTLEGYIYNNYLRNIYEG